MEPKLLKFDEERKSFCLQRAGNFGWVIVNEIVFVSILLPLKPLYIRSIGFDLERSDCKTK